jgi:dihydroxy-acid dehydratase
MATRVQEMIRALAHGRRLADGCDKTVSAQLMDAASARWPRDPARDRSVMAGCHHGKQLGACTDCYHF